VRGLSGNTVTTYVGPFDTYADVADRVEAKTGDPVPRMQRGGKPVDFGSPCTMGVHETLHVLGRLRAGVRQGGRSLSIHPAAPGRISHGVPSP
jgi:hypothetical protein